MLEMSISPRALTADPKEFESGPAASIQEAEDQSLEDPLLDLLRSGTTMKREEFLEELRCQRSGESVAT
jgi:hypothetical protein